MAQRSALPGRKSGLREWLFRPVDIAPLVFYRVLFGLLMFFDIGGYTVTGHLERKWVEPVFRFQYYGFEWVPMPSGEAFYGLVAVQMIAALGVMLGCFYRLSAVVLFLAVSLFFLFDQSNYQNHHYLICLLAAVTIFLPAHRSDSIDAHRRPALRSDVAPAWTLWLLRAHMAIAYFYGGLAKLHADWFQGAPLRIWFGERAQDPLLGKLLNTETAIWIVAYGGVIFDLLIVPLLLWRRTRVWAFLAAVGFHLSNAAIFSIGIFPFLSIALTALFFTPETHRKILRWFSPKRRRVEAGRSGQLDQPAFRWQRTVMLAVSVYLAWQLLMPFRHFLYPGKANWTEEGHRFAWHMMLRKKLATVDFIIHHPELNYTWRYDWKQDLTEWQYRKMAYHPDMIVQFARFLGSRLEELGYPHATVHALAFASLNGRAPSMMIDPAVNLAAVPRNLKRAEWILPMEDRRGIPPHLLTTNTIPPPGLHAREAE